MVAFKNRLSLPSDSWSANVFLSSGGCDHGEWNSKRLKYLSVHQVLHIVSRCSPQKEIRFWTRWGGLAACLPSLSLQCLGESQFLAQSAKARSSRINNLPINLAERQQCSLWGAQLRSEISFSRTCNIPNYIMFISHSPLDAWNASLVVRLHDLRSCMRTSTNICSVHNFLRGNTEREFGDY